MDCDDFGCHADFEFVQATTDLATSYAALILADEGLEITVRLIK